MSALANKSSSSAVDRYRAVFDAHFAAGDALTALRRSALEEFSARGFPTTRDEDWKYTNLHRLESRDFALPPAPGPIEAPSPDWVERGGARLVFVDGRYSPALSAPAAFPPGVTVAPLAQWAERDPASVAERLHAARVGKTPPLDLLNLALFGDGLIVDVAADAQTNEPIYFVHQWSREAQGAMSHPRIVVRVARRARCTLIEQYLGPADAEYFTNASTMLDIAEGARVQHYRVQQESTRSFHIGSVTARVATNGCYALHDLVLGASIGRTNVTALLDGPGAHTALHGLIAPSGSQHLDAHTTIDHIAPHTTSLEDYRGVADGRGRGVFNGKVIVRPQAQKVDAKQSSRNLLLSPTAEIDTKPELEIYANDVKCSHGATTGRLDAAALFYLRSRGVSENEARALLIRAFAESILSSVEHLPLKAHLEQRLGARFRVSGETT